MADNNNYTKFDKILILILSFIPGCGHMYIGLMKRGMFILISFFACAYLETSIFYRVFRFGFVIIWIFNVFDVYNCRKKIGIGKIVSDNVDDIKRVLMKHRKIIITVFGIISAVEITRSRVIIEKFDFMKEKNFFTGFVFDNVMIFLLICIGLYCLFFRNKKWCEFYNVSRETFAYP